MDDWERFCRAVKKGLPKELHCKFSEVQKKLEELEVEKLNEDIAKLTDAEQRVWLLKEIANIFYDGENYRINSESLAKWKNVYLISGADSENFNEIMYCYEAFLYEISAKNHVTDWRDVLENWNSINQTERRNSGKTSTKNESDKHGSPVNNVITYKERKLYMQLFLEYMEQMNIIEGIKGHFTYGELKKDGFFCTKVNENSYKVVFAEELLQGDWYWDRGYKCVVITGKLGSGKSILGCRIAEVVIKSAVREQWCLVRSSYIMEGQFGKDSKKYFSDFVKKALPKRGKMVVIIDDMGELFSKGELRNKRKLFDAAQYYNATLIITCRLPFAEELKDNRMPITQIWKMLKLDIEDEQRESIIQGLPVKDEMMEVRDVPVFRVMADRMIDAYEEYTDILENNFLFQEECYNALMRRERIKNRISDFDMKNLEVFMKEVAFQMYRYQAERITLAVCLNIFSDEDKLHKLVETEIFLEIIEVDKQLKADYKEWHIKGFVYSWLESYFLTKKIIDIYLENDKERMEVVNKIKVSKKYKEMINTLYHTLPADKKAIIDKNAK